jgi:aspartyl aminopeptidase
MLPLFSQKRSDLTLNSLLASASGIHEEDIISSDLFVCNRQRGAIIGSRGEFFCAPRIDDLQCVYSMTEGLIASSDSDAFSVLALYDNEETGSSSRQGAASSLLSDTLRRALLSLGKGEEDYLIALESSFMLSADNAHAKHPNHPELFDQQNAPILNGGIVIKTNASQRYTTDAISASLTEKLCERSGVPFQSYANRADLVGGSTLGNILVHQLPVASADVGLAQLSMHSCLETAGSYDSIFMMKMAKVFFETKFSLSCDGGYKMSDN